MLNYIDIILCIPLLWGMYKGFRKGLVIQITTLLALVLGIYGSIKFSGKVSFFLQNTLEINFQYLSIVAFALTFILIVITIHFLGKIVEKFVSLIAMGIVNKLFGVIFGLLKTALILSVILFIVNFADKKLKFIPSKDKDNSILYEPLSNIVPSIIPGVEEIFK